MLCLPSYPSPAPPLPMPTDPYNALTVVCPLPAHSCLAGKAALGITLHHSTLTWALSPTSSNPICILPHFCETSIHPRL